MVWGQCPLQPIVLSLFCFVVLCEEAIRDSIHFPRLFPYID